MFDWGNGRNPGCSRQDGCGGSGRAALGWKALGGEHGSDVAPTLPRSGVSPPVALETCPLIRPHFLQLCRGERFSEDMQRKS